MNRCGALLVFAAAGCAGAARSPERASATVTGAAPAAVPAPIECGEAVDGAGPLIGPGRLLVLGEMHGTDQVPALVARLACQSLAAGHPTVVAVELAAGEQAALEGFLAAADDGAATAALLQAPHWVDEWQDGRDSVAMLGLLQRVRGWRQAGHRVDVLAFDAPLATPATVRDQVMAARLAAVVQARSDAMVVALTGNMHSRKEPVSFGETTFEPMTYFIARHGVAAVTLDMRHGGGTAWLCEHETCAAVDVGPGKDRGRAPFLRVEPGIPGHDGYYFAGRVAASPPAAPR
jgi:hypothetical protein